MQPALAITVAYLLGSVPFAWVLGRAAGVDIRKVGSGNVGATNLGRALGRRWAITAFALDYAKGAAPPVFARVLEIGGDHALLVAVACAAAAILGHVFPIYLGFHGGKGVATGFGAMTALAWLPSAIAALVWFVLYGSTRAVSIASIGAAVAFPTAAWIAAIGEPFATSWPVPAFATAIGVLIIARHRDNIRRLRAGTEGRIGHKAPG